MTEKVRIGKRWVGKDYPTFIVAEIGGNFTKTSEGLRLIRAAVSAGADAVKLQTFRAETVTTRGAVYDMENTGKVSQFDLLRRYELSVDAHRALFEYARKKKILLFSTPAHPTDVDFLETFDVPVYKIGSDDVTNHLLLRTVGEKRKPVILATGMCTLEETSAAVRVLNRSGAKGIVLLHCVTSYPTYPREANLKAIATLAKTFQVPVGFSDHTLGIDVTLGAIALGACMIEKHFTLDKGAKGPDHRISLEPQEFEALVKGARRIEDALGDGRKRPAASEIPNRKNNRKSVVTVRPIKEKEKIRREMVDVKRPGYGIQPSELERVIGMRVKRNIEADEVLTWNLLY